MDPLDYRNVRGQNEQDFKEHRHDPLPFWGDRTIDPDGVYPPRAWTLLWMGTCCNQVEELVNRDIQRWGYVFWVSARMEAMGAKEILEKQWPNERWNQYDPRRNLDSEGHMVPGTDDDWHALGIFPVKYHKHNFLACAHD